MYYKSQFYKPLAHCHVTLIKLSMSDTNPGPVPRSRKRKRRDKVVKERRKREPKWKLELAEIETLATLYPSLTSESVTTFDDLPLSARTRAGLDKAGYKVPTEIQKEAIPHALRGRDMLGAAKTGSGKTLAFLIPVLETLWSKRWTSMDGLGAVVISPTRELAYQTFEVLKKVGAQHDLSAGLVIGGKDLKAEQERIQQTNIVVCTPGRLLQHMDETPNFDSLSLQILVLDEADRILDLGFEAAMNSILENLPRERQTLLFSATQTKSVRDLARLSLKDPEYTAVHENSVTSTPQRLTQSYMVCELHQKMDVLYSFVKNHLSSKVVVFLSSCKQVKFTYEAFCRLRPGVPLMALYGKQKQPKRVGIYTEFCRKQAAVLFCTDIAARGLDFPAVHWVVQLDCPEDANTYIHRVGRTARYERDGQALLVLLPSEEAGMVAVLGARKIPVTRIAVNPSKLVSVQRKLATFCVQDLEMKHWAQRSFICYLRSIHLQSNKDVFDVHKLPTDEYACSLGLPQPPRIRFLSRQQQQQQQQQDAGMRRDQLVAPSVKSKLRLDDDDDDNEGDDVIKFRRTILPSSIPDMMSDAAVAAGGIVGREKVVTKVTQAKKLLHKSIKASTHVHFGEDGEGVVKEEEEGRAIPSPSDEGNGGINLTEAQRALKKSDQLDRLQERNRIRMKHKELRAKRRQLREQPGEIEEEGGAVLAVPSDGEDEKASGKEEDSDQGEEHEQRPESGPSALEDDEELALHLLQS